MYEDFVQEYEKLKLALTQEEFEKAEMILLMILQKNPNLPEAKLHLEKVRAKLGSVSNYEFRVKAFLDQKDYANAEVIIKEASEKFEHNKKIKALIEYYNKRVEKIAARLSTNKHEGTVPSEDIEDIPGLESMYVPGVSRKKEESPWSQKNDIDHKEPKESIAVEMGILPETSESKSDNDINGLLRPPSDVVSDPEEAVYSPTTDKIRKLREETQKKPEQMAGRRKRKQRPDSDIARFYDDPKKRQAIRDYKTNFYGRRKIAKESMFDNPAVGKGLIVLMAALVLLPLIAAFVFLYQSASVNVDVPIITLPRWDEPDLKDGVYSFYKNKFDRLARGTITGEELDTFVQTITDLEDIPMHVLETFYSVFKNSEYRLTEKQIERIENWRNVTRLSHGLKTPITSDQLHTGKWNPSENSYDLSVPQSESFKLSIYGVLAGLLPGLILGLALARGRIPFINRIFEVFWEYWFAIPSIAILFICAWVFRDRYADSQSAYGFISLLMGLLIAPHIAFYVQQGFENIRKQSILSEIILGIIVIVSALAIGVARLIGEAVLTMGLLSAAEGNSAFAQSVASFAAPIFNSLQAILPGSFLIFGSDTIPEKGVLLNQTVSMMIAYKVLIYSLVITFIAQGMQIVVAYFGLKSDKAAEKTSISNFKMLSKSNIIYTLLGIALVILVVILFVNGQGVVDQTRTEKWSQDVNKESLGLAVNDTFITAAISGGAALLLGLLAVLFVSTFVRDRFHKASIEALLRIPLGISPLLFIVIAVEILNRFNATPNRINSIVVAALIIAPVAWSVLFRTFDKFNGAPYVRPDEVGSSSKKLFVFLAKILSFVSIGFFLMAISMGLLELFIGFKSDHSLVYQLFIMIKDNYQNPATIKVFNSFMSMMLNFIGASLLFKILSEISAQVARVKRLSTY